MEWPSYMSPELKMEYLLSNLHMNNTVSPLHSGYKIIGTYINSTMALHEALTRC